MSPHEATTPQQWKKAKKSNLEPVDVPSGNQAIIRRKPLDAFLRAGLIPNELLPIIQDALKSGKAEIGSEELLADSKKTRAAFDLIDTIVIECMVEPKVYPIPKKEEDRDEKKLYVDEVDWEDKEFVYQYAVGAVVDLKSFRSKQAELMASVSPSDDVAGAPVEPVGS